MVGNNRTVVLAMSGGVDSSVAAHLLARQGYNLVGVFMRHGVDVDETCETGASAQLNIVKRSSHRQGCCSAADAEDARRVADKLGIPFYALNLREDFDRIVDYFVDEYTRGRTPNPCVMCNNWLKFGRLFDYADSIDARYVATGHYARLRVDSADSASLWRGVDLDKDQSYVLFGVQRSQLPRMLLPVGDFQKTEIRRLADEFGLSVAAKPDSQEICFVSPGRHSEFVAGRRQRETRGELVTTAGQVVGRHDGIECFTIGQRKGLGVALGKPFFVVRIEPDTNRVVIGGQQDLACRELDATAVNWMVAPRQDAFTCSVQFRYNSNAVPATVHPVSPDRLRVEFAQPSAGVAPGQAVVCYDQDRVLAGGWIESTR